MTAMLALGQKLPMALQTTLTSALALFGLALVAAQPSAEAVMARHGLAPAEFDVLATLRRAPPPAELTPSEIRQAMFITSGGLTKVLRQLEARGLVGRSIAQADRRSKPVRLMPAARPLVEVAMAELLAELNLRVHAGLGAAEIGKLTRLLAKLSGAR